MKKIKIRLRCEISAYVTLISTKRYKNIHKCVQLCCWNDQWQISYIMVHISHCTIMCEIQSPMCFQSLNNTPAIVFHTKNYLLHNQYRNLMDDLSINIKLIKNKHISTYLHYIKLWNKKFFLGNFPHPPGASDLEKFGGRAWRNMKCYMIYYVQWGLN